MLLKNLFVDWMACLLSLIAFSLIVLNMERLGLIRLFLLRLSIIVLAVSFLMCAFTNISKEKIGAICEDGWQSYSIGSGTCSHHGGVETWRYKYWFDE